MPTVFPTIVPTITVTTAGTTTTTIPTTTVPTATTVVPTVTSPGGTGALMVKTLPSGATIYIDNQKSGVTPATISNLQPGDHELKLVKQGCKTSVRTVRIQAGKTTELPLIVFSPERLF